jgi:hypothetical protein
MEQRKTNPRGATPDQRLSWSEGLEAKEIFLASGRGRTISLDIPLYRSGDLQCAVKGAGPQREINPPRNWIAPPGSNRSGGGDNKAAGASGVEGRIRRYAAKSSCACEWGGWGRLSDDGPGHYNPDRSEDPWGRAEEPLERRCPSALGPSAQYEDFDRQAMGTKDECKPHDAKTSLIDGKAPSERPALKP